MALRQSNVIKLLWFERTLRLQVINSKASIAILYLNRLQISLISCTAGYFMIYGAADPCDTLFTLQQLAKD